MQQLYKSTIVKRCIHHPVRPDLYKRMFWVARLLVVLRAYYIYANCNTTQCM